MRPETPGVERLVIERVVVFWHGDDGRQMFREVAFDDAMIERAVLAGSKADTRCPDDTPCTHTTCHYRGILEAAFEGARGPA